MITCEKCGGKFEKKSKRGPAPKSCPDCKAGKKPEVQSSEKKVLTLRDVISVAELPLSVKQCDVVINAFTKARARAAKREKAKGSS